MTKPLTDDEKRAWRALLEGILELDKERPVRLTVDRIWGGQRYSLAPMLDDEKP